MDIWAATVATRLGFLVGFLGRLATTGRLRLLGLLRILGIFRIYARNVAFQIARERGYRYFIELDDDYQEFSYTYTWEGELKQRGIRSLDKVFDALIEFRKNVGALTVAMAQRGDFMGGKENNLVQGEILKRKAMNSFICDTEQPFRFFGKINEDVNTYVVLGSRGSLFLQVPHVALNQVSTQQSAGGMTDIYLDSGTYVKSFYTVMYAPRLHLHSHDGHETPSPASQHQLERGRPQDHLRTIQENVKHPLKYGTL